MLVQQELPVRQALPVLRVVALPELLAPQAAVRRGLLDQQAVSVQQVLAQPALLVLLAAVLPVQPESLAQLVLRARA